MPITRVDKDLDAHTMTVVAEYDAPVERVWQLDADHDLGPGGRGTYVMTGSRPSRPPTR